MKTANPERLARAVKLLCERRAEIDAFMEAYIFRPYGIDIKNCLIKQDLIAAKKLLDFSFSTRQGGQNKSSIQNYEKEKNTVIEVLSLTLKTLTGKAMNPGRRYEIALAFVNSIYGIGQKISTMFLKYLIFYSADFEGKESLVRELFIPLDSHVLRLIYTELDGERTGRLNLYDESINQAALKYAWDKNNKILIKENRLLSLQKAIRADFDYLKIREPPIILDYLWYVGSMFCSLRYGDLGCKICFLKYECEAGSRI